MWTMTFFADLINKMGLTKVLHGLFKNYRYFYTLLRDTKVA